MNCPVCNRNNSVTLSICPSCGAMLNDSVRAELITKVFSAPKPTNFVKKENALAPGKEIYSFKSGIHSSKSSVPASKPAAPVAEPNPTASTTAEKPVSPTLVEFHSKNTVVPEWRLQLQNVVRQRSSERARSLEQAASVPTSVNTSLVTSGANALKVETIQQIEEEEEDIQHENPKLASALKRIKKSRQKFYVEEKPKAEPISDAPKSNKNYPFYIASKTNEVETPKKAELNVPVKSPVKPKLAISLQTENRDFDANKPPALPNQSKISTSFEKSPAVAVSKETLKVEETIIEKKPEEKEAIIKARKKVEPEIVKPVEMIQTFEATEPFEKTLTEIHETHDTQEFHEGEEIDDRAPFAMRFNAGLFDLIIGSFFSLILLAPFLLTGEGWTLTTGVSAFLATSAVVMFIYMTTAIGLKGRTFGMRLFSLELVDIEGEHYPTIHQAAVSSAVYILSLTFGGAGFLTLLFNDEKRAVHDIVSKTIVVKEF